LVKERRRGFYVGQGARKQTEKGDQQKQDLVEKKKRLKGGKRRCLRL